MSILPYPLLFQIQLNLTRILNNLLIFPWYGLDLNFNVKFKIISGLNDGYLQMTSKVKKTFKATFRFTSLKPTFQYHIHIGNFFCIQYTHTHKYQKKFYFISVSCFFFTFPKVLYSSGSYQLITVSREKY